MRREYYFYDTRDSQAFKCHDHGTVVKPLAVLRFLAGKWLPAGPQQPGKGQSHGSGYQAETRPSGKGNSATRAAHEGDFLD